MKTERKERKAKKQATVDGPNHCIHCDEDPCNDDIYYDEHDYVKNPVAYNSAR
jgi:hypothetical protein